MIVFRGTKSSSPETMRSDDQRYFISPESESWATIQIERFTDVLRHNPALCQLYSRFNIGTRAWADHIYTLWGRETVIKCAADDAIASCLDCLPNIVHLCTGESEKPYSQTLQDAVAKTLRTSVERLSMAQDLVMMRPLREAIANSPRLRELCIASKEPHMPLGGGRIEDTSHRPIIKSLVVCQPTESMAYWLSATSLVSLAAVEELTISKPAAPPDASLYKPLCHAVGATVRILTLASWDDEFVLDLSLFPALRTLRVCGMMLSMRGLYRWDEYSYRVAALLRPIRDGSPVRLEEVIFVFAQDDRQRYIVRKSFSPDRRSRHERNSLPNRNTRQFWGYTEGNTRALLEDPWVEVSDILTCGNLPNLRKVAATVSDWEVLDNPVSPRPNWTYHERHDIWRHELLPLGHGLFGGSKGFSPRTYGGEVMTAEKGEEVARTVLQRLCPKLVKRGLL